MAGIRFTISTRRETKEKPALTQEELHRLIKATEHESADVRTMIIVGMLTGLRFCELSALHWDDIDLDAGTLRIQRSQQGGVIGPPKTKVTRRNVALYPTLRTTLKAHKEWQGQGQKLVFPSTVGTYRFPSMLTKPFDSCCEVAGIDKRLSSRSMRITANTLLTQAVGEAIAKKLIGRSTDAMNRQYLRVDEATAKAAQQAAFGDVFGPQVVPAT